MTQASGQPGHVVGIGDHDFGGFKQQTITGPEVPMDQCIEQPVPSEDGTVPKSDDLQLIAGVSLVLIGLMRELYLAVGGSGTLGTAGATALRVVAAAVVLGLPTTLMGGTLPAIAQAMEQRRDRGRRIVAALYGVNTLGAVLGALLTTFVLIELVGVMRSLWLACLVNLLLAAASLAFRLDSAARQGYRNAGRHPVRRHVQPLLRTGKSRRHH